MKLFRFFVLASVVLATFFFHAIALRAGEVSVSSDGIVRVQLGASASQRIAVDVSSNLVNWTPATNAAPTPDGVAFPHDIAALTDPARYFRLADGDETFAIAGYVDGGPTFGGVAGATIRLDPTGLTATSDVHGFFHFDARLARTNLPVTLSVVSTNFSAPTRQISSLDAGTFSVLTISLPAPIQPVSGATYHFHVTSGSRAGTDYALSLTDTHFTLSGGLSGEGTYATSASGLIDLTFNAGVSEFRLWIPANSTNGFFAGIPTANGTLSGNGEVTVQLPPPPIVGPGSLSGQTFTLSENLGIDFGDTTFFTHAATFGGTTTGTTAGGPILLANSASNQNGTYTAVKNGSVWSVTLTTTASASSIAFTFQTLATGTYRFERPGMTATTGAFTMALTPTGGGTYPAPATLSHISVQPIQSFDTATKYEVNFSGGTTGTFTYPNDPNLYGTYTYAPNGNSAHLNMRYTGAFQGDYDDMNLQFNAGSGSTAASSFTGTQAVSTTTYTFTGTFTYSN